MLPSSDLIDPNENEKQSCRNARRLYTRLIGPAPYNALLTSLKQTAGPDMHANQHLPWPIVCASEYHLCRGGWW